ncbi:MAG: nicotinate phosphoribosyltransferase [Bryobacteraceae bacterium]|jgi:nicotinate phosphoribosyltransferase
MNGLLTDLYELTMAAGYYAAGKHNEIATFELSVRRLPRHRRFVLAAGLHKAIDYLLNLRFEADEIAYLRDLPNFRHAPQGFWDYLADFRFTGDVFAVPEGTVLYEGQPILNLRAPLIEAQIPETYLLSAITFETLIASKAAQIVESAQGRDVVEFGTRRAHTPEAGVLGARAAYIGGCAGTSNTLAGFRYGVPVFGTAAHSWVMSFESEAAAFAELQRLLGDRTVQLLDTFDTLEGARRVAHLGGPLWGVRIDSGDILELARDVRRILNEGGMAHAKIMASGDLDETKIGALLDAGAPIDAFGVGTELATSGDAPSMGTIYKLVEIEREGKSRPVFKNSPDKRTLPGAKQLFRYPEHDLLGLHDECAGGAEAMLKPFIIGGNLIRPLASLEKIRRRARIAMTPWPASNRRTELSVALHDLNERVHESILRY